MQIRVASQLCSRHVQRAGVTTQRGRSRARRFQKGGGASRPGPRPAADWWLAASQGAKSSSSGGPRAARPGRRPVPALLAPSSLSHAAARPSRHCPSHGPAGPLCREGHRSTASPAAERAPCCSARGEAPALPQGKPACHDKDPAQPKLKKEKKSTHRNQSSYRWRE